MEKTAEKETSMVLYSTQYHCIEDLSNENKGILLDVLFRYIIEPDLRSEIQGDIVDGETRMAFKFIADRIEADKVRYVKKCNQNRDNANKRWKSDANGCERIQSDANGCERTIRNANDAYNDNVNDNDNDKEKGNENEYTPPQEKNIVERYKDFIADVQKVACDSDFVYLDKFIAYWSQRTPDNKRMKFETLSAWNTRYRLDSWIDNERKFGKNGSTRKSSTEVRAEQAAERMQGYESLIKSAFGGCTEI